MNCKYCGAEEEDFTNSLHCWEVKFTCGAVITGAIDELVGFEEKPCKKQ